MNKKLEEMNETELKATLFDINENIKAYNNDYQVVVNVLRET